MVFTGSLGQRACAAFLDADYAETINLIGLAPPSMELHLLRVRALYRSGRNADALSAVDLRVDGDSDQQLVAEALRGAIMCELGSVDAAREILDRVVHDAEGAGPEARSEIAYYAAVAAWVAKDLQRADELIASAPHVRGVPAARLAQLSGWVEVRRERYHAAVKHYFESFAHLDDAGGEQDIRFRAKGVLAVAIIASETIDLDLWAQLQDYCDETRWTHGVRREHFLTVTCRRFIALLQGNRDEAWLRSREAVFLAPNDAMRAIAETNAAVTSRLVGDHFAERRQFEAAWRLIKPESLGWGEADVEERVALTNFAIEAGEVMKAEAQRCMMLYKSIAGKRDRKLALTGDRRVVAFDDMAAGRICEIAGEKDEAVRQYENSLRIWSALGYRMRAALVAQALHQLTGSDEYLHDIQLALHRAPNAWFCHKFAAPESRSTPLPELEQLTKAERNVLRELLAGKSSRDIALALGRSPFTINNHTRRLFDVFGVRSRAALIARAAERGLSPAQVA